MVVAIVEFVIVEFVIVEFVIDEFVIVEFVIVEFVIVEAVVAVVVVVVVVADGPQSFGSLERLFVGLRRGLEHLQLRSESGSWAW